MAIISLMAVLFSCENNMATIKNLTQSDTLPSESAKDIVVRYSDSGILKAVLKSPEMQKFAGEEELLIFPKGIHVFFYDSLENISSEIESDYAIQRLKDQIVEVKKNVVIFDYQNGKELNTEVLYWNQRKKEIYNDAFVTIKEQGRIMHGDSMRADENMEDFELFQVRATIDIVEEDSLQ